MRNICPSICNSIRGLMPRTTAKSAMSFELRFQGKTVWISLFLQIASKHLSLETSCLAYVASRQGTLGRQTSAESQMSLAFILQWSNVYNLVFCCNCETVGPRSVSVRIHVHIDKGIYLPKTQFEQDHHDTRSSFDVTVPKWYCLF